METGAYRTAVNIFGGYNHTLRPSDGEWYDMCNLTSRHYPVLSVRDPRKEYADAGEPHAIIGKDKLVWCDGDKVYYGSDTNIIHTLEDDKEPILVSLGANVVIFPDGVMYNTVTEEKRKLSCAVTTEVPFGGIQPVPFTLTLCDADGKDLAEQYVVTTKYPSNWKDNWEDYYIYDNGFVRNGDSNRASENWQPNFYYYPAITISEKPPASVEDGVTWIDTSSDTPAIKKYSGTMGVWVKFSATYFKLSHIESSAYYGYLSEFRAGDTVTLDLSPGGTKKSRFLNGDYAVTESGSTELPSGETEHYIICAGACGVPDELYGSVKRTVPPMDFVIEGDNRLWGCRYGKNRNGEFTNEIYACKVGDPANWFSYQGVSTDSYAVSVGSDGPFTGAIFYAGCPTFFKERYIHRVGGSVPANYTMYTTKTDGVQAGSGASLCCVRNTLYYKSPTDIMAYTGSYPVPVSAALGAVRYYDAVAGEIGGKYYISMREEKLGDSAGRWRMFVYDTDKGLWHIEDETHAIGFARVSDRLFCMSEDKIFCVDGGTEQDEKPIEWYAQTGVRTLSDVSAKSVSALCIHAVLGEGSSMSVFIEYDSNGKWEPCGNITGERREAAKLPITPRRCDHYALRIEGVGRCQIYSITQEIEEGSDVRWR